MCCRNCVEKLVDRDGKDAECPVCCTKVKSWFALQMLVPAASHVSFVALNSIHSIPCWLEQSKLVMTQTNVLCFSSRELQSVCCQVTRKLMHASVCSDIAVSKRLCKLSQATEHFSTAFLAPAITTASAVCRWRATLPRFLHVETINISLGSPSECVASHV